MGLWHCFTYIVLDGWKIDEHRTCWKPPTGRNGKNNSDGEEKTCAVKGDRTVLRDICH